MDFHIVVLANPASTPESIDTYFAERAQRQERRKQKFSQFKVIMTSVGGRTKLQPTPAVAPQPATS